MFEQGHGAGCNNTTLRARGVLHQTGVLLYQRLIRPAIRVTSFLSATLMLSSIDIAPVISMGEVMVLNTINFGYGIPKWPVTTGLAVMWFLPMDCRSPGAVQLIHQVLSFKAARHLCLSLIQAVGSATINFRETDKTASENNVFGLRARPAYPAIFVNLMAPSGDKFILIDGVGAGFGKRFSSNVDKDDATKLWNFNEKWH
jgi:hypothetical protein